MKEFVRTTALCELSGDESAFYKHRCIIVDKTYCDHTGTDCVVAYLDHPFFEEFPEVNVPLEDYGQELADEIKAAYPNTTFFLVEEFSGALTPRFRHNGALQKSSKNQ